MKFYSSGMQLRLGFSIAAFLNPDIFVVDEALAVGDAGFQAKCAARMRTLVGEGRTLVFVSHNLPVIQAICGRSLLLLDGRVHAIGDTQDVLSQYMEWVDERNQRGRQDADGVVGRGLAVSKTTVHGLDGQERYRFERGEGLIVQLHVRSTMDHRSCAVTVGFSDGRPGALAVCSMLEDEGGTDLPPGDHTISCRIESLPLAARTYEVWMCIHDPSEAVLRIGHGWRTSGSSCPGGRSRRTSCRRGWSAPCAWSIVGIREAATNRRRCSGSELGRDARRDQLRAERLSWICPKALCSICTTR